MIGFTGVIYTNFNVTPCDKKCNFFHFFDMGGFVKSPIYTKSKSKIGDCQQLNHHQ